MSRRTRPVPAGTGSDGAPNAARLRGERVAAAADREVALLEAVAEAGGVAALLDMVRRARQRFNGHRDVGVLEALARWVEARRGT